MKKNKITIEQRRAAQKRGLKRSTRLKKTQGEKHLRKAKVLEEKKAKERAFNDAMRKMFESKFGQ